MDLSNNTPENIEYMVDAIKTKLRVASGAVIQASHFNAEQYEDLRDIYDMVSGKDNFSISEIEAIIAELGRLRKEG